MSEGWHPAFPIQDMNAHPGPMGLSKRELFAAMVLQGMHSVPLTDPAAVKLAREEPEQLSHIMARTAVAQADALLAELEKVKT